jgi:hypothetical protein
MDVYPHFVRQLFAEEHHQAVFEDTARWLFKLANRAEPIRLLEPEGHGQHRAPIN